jgi:MerR family transcriptional regulator, copper efflux regulator
MATDLERLALRHGIRPGVAEVVGAAAARLGTTPRMLRYRESLGLVTPARSAGGYRTYGERDLLAAAYAADLEARHGVPPAAVAFALRAVHEPELRDELALLGRLTRRGRAVGEGLAGVAAGGPPAAAAHAGVAGGAAARTTPEPAAALDFETRKARALLRLAS